MIQDTGDDHDNHENERQDLTNEIERRAGFAAAA
jgi:hypothetical protein